ALSRLFVLFIVVDLGEFGIDDVFLVAVTARRCTGAVAGLLLRGLLIHRLAEFHRGLRQSIGLGRYGVRIAAFEGLLQVGQSVLDGASVALANFRAVFGERLLGRMHQRFGVVLGLDLRLALLVLLGMRFGILDHFLDVGFGQAAGSLD